MKIHEDAFIDMNSLPAEKIVHCAWLRGTVDMTVEQYRSTIEHYIQFAREHGTEKPVADNTGMR